jgi:hypothetical protein
LVDDKELIVDKVVLINKHPYDMGVVMRDYFFKDDVDGTKYGHLPKMAEQQPLVRR